jgi:hypothetical protein
MTDQRQADFGARALHHADQAGGQFLFEQHAHDVAVHSLRQQRMARMRLHDQRTARRQRRSGVAAEHRERERKVAGGEHRHRSQRHAHPLHRRVARRRAAGHRRVVQHREGHAALRNVGEAAQLKSGAVQLAREARGAERRLVVGQRNERFAISLEGGSQCTQEGAALRARAVAPEREGRFGRSHGGVDLVGAGRR